MKRLGKYTKSNFPPFVNERGERLNKGKSYRNYFNKEQWKKVRVGLHGKISGI